MNNPLISIIIPVYNIENYLKECVESVLDQTFDDYEIILVDDGSTDNSGSVCNELSLENNKIKTFHKRNGGLSSARNFGIKHSNGKYIIFLDSDDYWVNNEILSLFVSKAEENDLDVVRGEYLDVNEKEEILLVPEISADKLSYKDKIFSSYEMIKYIINGRYFTVLFLYRKSTICSLLYNEKRKFQEDIDFAIRYFSQELKCGYLPIQFYAYRHRENSIISTPRLINVIDSFALTDVYYEYAHKVNDKRLSQLYLYNSVMMYYWTLETVASDLYFDRYNEIDKIVDLKSLRNRICSWIKEIQNKKFPIHCYVSPFIGVSLFRLRWRIGNVLRFLKILPIVKNTL